MTQDDMDDTDPLDSILKEEINPAPPGAQPGVPWVPMNIMPEAIPEATPDTMICLRGPCTHYIEMISKFKHGNTPGTLAEGEGKQCNRFCKVIPGESVELTDELVTACTHWDPVDPKSDESLDRQERRSAYFHEHPEHGTLKSKESA